MEIYVLPITTEESRNYHKFIYQLKALSLTDWIKAYIVAIVYTLLGCTAIMIFSQKLMLMLWYQTGIIFKVTFFLVMFLGAALQRSKTVQLRAMLQKYFISNLPQEFLGGHVQLKKIKVSGDKILVYYRKFKN